MELNSELRRDVGRTVSVGCFKRFRGFTVQADAARRVPAFNERLADYGVHEIVPLKPPRYRFNQIRGERFVDRIEQFILGSADHVVYDLEIETVAEDGSMLEERPGCRGETVDSPIDNKAHTLRDRKLRRCDRRRCVDLDDKMAKQFFDEERVAIRLRDKATRQMFIKRRAVANPFRDCVRREPGQDHMGRRCIEP